MIVTVLLPRPQTLLKVSPTSNGKTTIALTQKWMRWSHIARPATCPMPPMSPMPPKPPMQPMPPVQLMPPLIMPPDLPCQPWHTCQPCPCRSVHATDATHATHATHAPILPMPIMPAMQLMQLMQPMQPMQPMPPVIIMFSSWYPCFLLKPQTLLTQIVIKSLLPAQA